MENKKYIIHVDIILFIIFLILKLDGIIDWKWVWVFSPLWIVWCIQACLCIAAAIAKATAGWVLKNMYRAPSGDPLVWDAKTSTLYGPWSAEDNETEKE